MTDNHTTTDLEKFLAGASIDDTVATLRPDYRALLIAVSGLASHLSPNAGESLLTHAERAARELLSCASVEELPHVAAWREAYRAFGAKPQRTRYNLEALTRRAGAAGSGLPRINPLPDLYNAIIVGHQVPVGGEDLTAYAGAPRLIRATGTEPFDTTADGEAVVEHPEVNEVVWYDDVGVTCRRWTGAKDDAPSSPRPPPRCSSWTPRTHDRRTAHRSLGPDVRVATRFLAASSASTRTAASSHPQETRP